MGFPNLENFRIDTIGNMFPVSGIGGIFQHIARQINSMVDALRTLDERLAKLEGGDTEK